MHITVFGASGRVGKHVTKISLEKGNSVIGFMREIEPLMMDHPHLQKNLGDIRNSGEVRDALNNTDAVVCCVGDRNLHGKITLVSDSMGIIIPLMEEMKINRIITLGGTGILQHDPEKLNRDMPGFPEFLLNVSEDHLKAFKLLEKSNLDWTIVCPPQIIDIGPTGNFTTREHYFPEGSYTIAAGNVGEFISNELVENRFLRMRVGIATAS